MSVPLVAILTRHQQKMAAIIHANKPEGNRAAQDSRLEEEVAELRQLVAQQAILLDDLQSMHRRLLERAVETEAVRNRLGS